MKKRSRFIIWPGALIVMIGALVTMDVIMLIAASRGTVYTVDPRANGTPAQLQHEFSPSTPAESASRETP